jgi:hypothetical protein
MGAEQSTPSGDSADDELEQMAFNGAAILSAQHGTPESDEATTSQVGAPALDADLSTDAMREAAVAVGAAHVASS